MKLKRMAAAATAATIAGPLFALTSPDSQAAGQPWPPVINVVVIGDPYSSGNGAEIPRVPADTDVVLFTAGETT